MESRSGSHVCVLGDRGVSETDAVVLSMTPTDSELASSSVADALQRMGILAAGQDATMQRLTGGVSSDIWRVDLPGGSVCVKRALAQLRVAATWLAPIERSRHEWNWYRTVDERLPGLCPRPLARDPQTDTFAMEFLSPERYRLWKSELLAGRIDPAMGHAAGSTIGRIHAATADDTRLAAEFATDDCFYSIRLEPYLEATARAQPDVAVELMQLLRVTADTKLVLVHGDASPKNIMVGPQGPVILDAECAWYGDPAFDVAFCLNHLLLKCLLRSEDAALLADTYVRFVDAYRPLVTWEDADAVEARASRLIAGLLLARVDGKSPVEYITRDEQRAHVRRAAKGLLRQPETCLRGVLTRWREEIAS